MNSENNMSSWSVTIPASGKGATGTIILGWGLLLAAALWVGSTPGMIRNPTILAVGFSFFGLVVVATINAYLLKTGKRGGLVLDIDGFAIRRGWRADSRCAWDDVAKFDTLLVSPNDGSSRLNVGFYRKVANAAPGPFVSFPETLEMPSGQLVSVLEYVRKIPVAERNFLPSDLKALVRLAPTEKRVGLESTSE